MPPIVDPMRYPALSRAIEVQLRVWPEHAAFGSMSGRDWSRLMAKHFDHHLRQFSA